MEKPAWYEDREELAWLYPADVDILDAHFTEDKGSDFKDFCWTNNPRMTLEAVPWGWYAQFDHGAINGRKKVYSGNSLELAVLRIQEFLDDDPYTDDPMEE